MKEFNLFIAFIVIAVMLLTACSKQGAVETADLLSTTQPASSLAGNIEKSTVLESVTAKNEPTTQKTTEPSTTEKASTTAKQTTKKQSTTAKPTTTKAATTKRSRCTNKDNHSMMCGNMGKWYNSRSELKADYMRVSDYWLAKLDNEEIDWDTYMKNCPQGYECWSCADCGKWTGNYN